MSFSAPPLFAAWRQAWRAGYTLERLRGEFEVRKAQVTNRFGLLSKSTMEVLLGAAIGIAMALVANVRHRRVEARAERMRLAPARPDRRSGRIRTRRRFFWQRDREPDQQEQHREA